MKILVIHQYYLAPGRQGGSRFNELARLWTAAGHDVEIIAGTVDYATGETLEDTSGWLTTRREAGILVRRCHVPSSYGRGYVGRMWAFLGFTVSSAFASLTARRPDVIIASSPPLTTAVAGWLASVRHRRPWVFEVRDLWPESAVTTGVLSERAWLTRGLYALERFACGRATVVNVLTPAFAADLQRRGLATNEKLAFVPNGADLESFVPSPRNNEIRRSREWGDRFVALYAGAHGRANALMQLVDTAELLRGRDDILIVSVGDGPERRACEAAAQARGLTNIRFLGSVGKAEMPAYVNAADAGLAVLQDNPTFKTVYPNKVFDYMACGKPVVLAIDGVARELVCETAAAGLFASPENPRELASAIQLLCDEPERAASLGASGRAWVVANVDRRVLAERYLGVLQPLVGSRRPRYFYRDRIKRLVDIVVSSLGLIVLSPVLAGLALAVRLRFGRPVFFRQLRPGRSGRPFTILKFRTMSDRSEQDGTPLADADRLDGFGRWLRSTSLDELPELLNVLRGEMSLVGPRPLLMRYLGRYTPQQMRRHEVRPGITGLAQVRGRNALAWEQRFELDVHYVDHCSAGMDLRIALETLFAVIRRENISQTGQATASEFMGSVETR